MRYVVVGLGNIGSKRKAVLGDRCVASVDPFNPVADFRMPGDCPPGRYDAAVLAVPNDVKIELLEFFLGQGKHVLVEKPLILDQRTADRLLECRARTGAIWYTSYNFRFEPHVVSIRQHLEAGHIGRMYRARMFYGNGTVANIAGSWRDSRYGVLEDMASHLVDLTGYLFGKFGSEFNVWERRGHELKGFDHCILATADRSVVVESSFLSWKNRWRIEVTGEQGALEMDGLTKWGQSQLLLWRRRLPSGPPDESLDTAYGPDPTWAADVEHFERLARSGETSCQNDLWISRTISLAASARLGAEP